MDNKDIRDIRNATVGLAELVVGLGGFKVAAYVTEAAALGAVYGDSIGDKIAQYACYPIGLVAVVSGSALLTMGVTNILRSEAEIFKKLYLSAVSILGPKNPEQ